MKKCLALLLIALLALPVMAWGEQSGLYVNKLDLPEDFILGMDISSVLSLEQSGVKFYDQMGVEKDVFVILKENGVNFIRVRIWNDPFDQDGNSYGGGNNDIRTAVEIAKRAQAQGLPLLVNFHYSDFWADPGKQMAPKAWEGLKIADKAEALYQFTLDSLQQIKNTGAAIGMVQLGNETNGRMSGERTWMNIYKLMNAGSKAVREVAPDAKVAAHFTNPESADSMRTFASKLDYYKLDYDVFATSYYPYWHGTLDNLKQVLSDIKATYGKEVLVAETSYAYTLEDSDFSGNSIGEGGNFEKPWPITVQGQANAVSAITRAVVEVGGLGIFYWEGAWVSVGDTYEGNREKWESFGSGWASSFAAAYDPKDAGVYYGGSACDNQALFDRKGRALPSLEVFRLMRTGNEAPLAIDAMEDARIMVDLNGVIILPNTVNALMNDGSKQEIPVTWDSIDQAAMKAGGEKTWLVKGEAGGATVFCHVAMVEYNFLNNYSFEDAQDESWVATNLGSTEQLYVEEKKSDSLTGLKQYHFYSAAAASVEFTLEQEVEDLPQGSYRFSLALMGGDGGKTDIYTYVKINGETRYTQPSDITVYNSWDIPVIEGIEVKKGDRVTVGVYVSCQGAGAWGKIDDAKLSSQ